MTKLVKISGNVMVKYLQLKGFYITHRKGSHVTMKNKNIHTVVPVGNKTLPIGTQSKILFYANINKDKFMQDYKNGLVK